MFLIVEKTGRHAFYLQDPKGDGFQGKAERVDYFFPDELLVVEPGNRYLDVADLCLGRSKTDSTQYRPFASKLDCQQAGFVPLGNDFGERIVWDNADE
jgi:hypothetical protein